MNLKTATYLIRYIHVLSIVIGILCILSGFIVHLGYLQLLIPLTGLVIIIMGFFIRRRLVNYFLRRTVFKFEFISLLEQLELPHNEYVSCNIEFLRTEPGTREFISSNNLKTRIRQTSSKLYMALAGLIIGGATMLFLDLRKYKAELIYTAIVLTGIISLKVIYPATAKNDPNPFLCFNETGLEVNKIEYPWHSIISWQHEPDDDRDGYVSVFYKKADDSEAQIKIDLSSTNASLTELTLLLTHFKKYYG